MVFFVRIAEGVDYNGSEGNSIRRDPLGVAAVLLVSTRRLMLVFSAVAIFIAAGETARASIQGIGVKPANDSGPFSMQRQNAASGAGASESRFDSDHASSVEDDRQFADWVWMNIVRDALPLPTGETVLNQGTGNGGSSTGSLVNPGASSGASGLLPFEAVWAADNSLVQWLSGEYSLFVAPVPECEIFHPPKG